MSDAPGDFTIDGMDVRGQTRVFQRFANATKALHDRLLGIVTDEVEQVADNARARMGELFKNPGKMQSAISTTVEDGGNMFVYGAVTASGLPYLAIHEYGGVIATPEIFPTNAKMLHFLSPGNAMFTASKNATGEVFTPHTKAHATPIPERSYMRYALQQRRAAIYARFAQAAADSLEDG